MNPAMSSALHYAAEGEEEHRLNKSATQLLPFIKLLTSAICMFAICRRIQRCTNQNLLNIINILFLYIHASITVLSN